MVDRAVPHLTDHALLRVHAVEYSGNSRWPEEPRAIYLEVVGLWVMGLPVIIKVEIVRAYVGSPVPAPPAGSPPRTPSSGP